MAYVQERRDASGRLRVHYPLGERMCTGDLLFVQGRPVLVISWRTIGWKRVPYIYVSLDEDRLKPATRPGDYVYEAELALPAGASG